MHQLLLERLKDERSKRVIFVSHCLLNENTRYFGGAFQRGCVNEIVDSFQQQGLGIYQMRCPEQHAWGGVLQRYVLPFYGSKGTILYKFRQVLLPLFLWYTRLIYWRIAKCPVAQCDRRLVNKEAVAACMRDREGWFIAAIQRQLRRKRITVKWYEHDLLSEIRGKPIRLRGKNENDHAQQTNQ